MARPRVFISSTYYDLKTMRSELDRFVQSQGYEPVRHEEGHIAYGAEKKPEEYAYKEVGLCDILVCVVGGRYGTQSSDPQYSITQKELKTAHDNGKQVYIFIERPVSEEFRFYLKNKATPNVQYSAVDNTKVYEFLEEVHALPKGNPIFSFDTASEITTRLAEQWAGLFQRLLVEQKTQPVFEMVTELKQSLQTVHELVTYLKASNEKGTKVIEDILFADHPLFGELKKAMRNRYRIYFASLQELNEWLTTAKFMKPVEELEWDDPNYREWLRTITPLGNRREREQHLLAVKRDLFREDGTLRPMSASQWQADFVRYKVTPFESPKSGDEIPF